MTDIYHEMIVDYSRNPVNFGSIENPDATHHDANPLCGDTIDMDLRVREGRLEDVKFRGRGCAICMACASVLTEIAKGKAVDEARAIAKDDVLGELGLENLQAVRIKCALLSLKALKMALYKYLATSGGDASALKEDADGLY